MAKQFEPCSFNEAEAFEINGKIYEIDNTFILKDNFFLYIKEGYETSSISCEDFHIFNIKCLKEEFRLPIEFTYTFGSPVAIPEIAYGRTFYCVEVMKDRA